MGTDVNITPTAGMPPVTTETVAAPVTTTGISTTVPNSASLEALGNQQAAANSVAAGELAVTPTISQTVEGQAAGKDAEAQQELDNNAERSKLIAAKMPAIEQAEKDHQAAQDRYANHTFYDYLANRAAGDKITSRIAIALNAGANAYLGIPGNELAEQLQNDVNRDFEKQKVQLHSKEKIAEWKKEGVKDLYGKLQGELAALDVKQAGAMRAVGAKAAAMALRAGIPEAEAKQNVVVAKADESAAKLDLSAKQRYEKQATASTVGQTHSVQTTSTKGGAKPGSEDVKATVDFDDGIRQMDRLIKEIEAKPEAWDEYKANTETWKRAEAAGNIPVVGKGREALQGVGAANVAPEQGLKTPEAKRIHQQQEKINTALAKAMGGVITEGDVARVSTAQANLSLTPKEKVAQIKQMRDDLLAKRKAYEANRGVAPAAPAAGSDLVPIKSGKYAGKMARRMPDGSYELVE